MLTPIDIQNHVLKSTMGGYNKKETDDFIESIQVSYEQLYKENSDLKKKITTLSEGIQYYKQMEGTLQKTLVLAEQTASETLETSKNAAAQVEKESRAKAEVMLREAKSRADGLVADAQEKANILTRESEERAAALKKDSEEKAASLTKESEERAASLKMESEAQADKVTSEAQEKADTLVRDSQKKADTLVTEAETKADNIMQNARERAERIMADTRKSADEVIADTRKQTEEKLAETGSQMAELTGIVKQLMGCYDAYKLQFQNLLKKQLDELEEDAYQVDSAELEKLLSSQQVQMAEEQAAAREQVDRMQEHTSELEEPVPDTAPAREETPAEDLLAGGLTAGEDSDAPAEHSGAETVSLNIETPSSEEIVSGQGIHVAEEEAQASYKLPEAEETETAAEETSGAEETDEVQSRLREIDSIAAEALKDLGGDAGAFHPESSMLGTSYDDFVPVTTETAESETTASSETPSEDTTASILAEVSAMAEKVAESTENPAVEIPPTTTDELPTVQEAYDAETYVTNETYFGSADNMTYSIPDPVPAAEGKTEIQAEAVETTADEVQIPVPETTVSEDVPVTPHMVPMPDFSKLDAIKNSAAAAVAEAASEPAPDLDAIAAEAMASLQAESSQTEESAATVQEAYHPEEYVTNETYFGSADNIPYTGSVASAATAAPETDFSDGISGVDPTGNGLIPPAPGELFTAPSEFDAVPPADDEFAVTKPEAAPEVPKAPETPSVTPFTFIDADQ